MVQALLDNLSDRLGCPVQLVAVSTHPAADRKAYERIDAEVTVASQRPVEMAALHVPLALLAGLLRVMRLPWRWACRPSALRALAEADVVADLSGISFVDGRRFVVLVYNTLVVAIPLLLGRPVVKCSQALGPFRTVVNRTLAQTVLPQVAAVCARGEATAAHLRTLGLTNVRPATDLAFTMRVPDQVRKQMQDRLAAVAPGPYLVVSPSQVVDTHCRSRGIDYPRIIADFIDAVVNHTGYAVVVIAHSAQPADGVNHMNDLPLCREVVSTTRARERVIFLDEDLLPTELRAVIGEAAMLVTSRFHAMISGLAERKPMLVIGWSHKYGEVLAPFGLSELAMPYEDLTSGEAMLARTEEMLKRGDELVASIERHLPAAVAGAETSFEALAAALGTGGVR